MLRDSGFLGQTLYASSSSFERPLLVPAQGATSLASAARVIDPDVLFVFPPSVAELNTGVVPAELLVRLELGRLVVLKTVVDVKG